MNFRQLFLFVFTLITFSFFSISVSADNYFDKKMSKLSADISNTFPTPAPSNNDLPTYGFSNEFPFEMPFGPAIHKHLDFKKSITQLSMTEPVETQGRVRVAILVGNSSVHAALPELQRHADLILLLNIDQEMHSWGHCLLRSIHGNEKPSLEEWSHFLTKYCASSSHMLEIVKRNVSDLSSWHPLFNRQRWVDSVEALEKLTVMPVHLNVLDATRVAQLSDILLRHKAVVTIINLSDSVHLMYRPSSWSSFYSLPYLLFFGANLEGFNNMPLANGTHYFSSYDENKIATSNRIINDAEAIKTDSNWKLFLALLVQFLLIKAIYPTPQI